MNKDVIYKAVIKTMRLLPTIQTGYILPRETHSISKRLSTTAWLFHSTLTRRLSFPQGTIENQADNNLNSVEVVILLPQ